MARLADDSLGVLPMGLASLDLVFREASLAADLTMASISLHVPIPGNAFSGPCSIEKYPFSRMANRYTRIFDAGGSLF